jgi:predicted phage terminase large subunit-like protein
VRAWNRSMGEVQLASGGSVFVDGADDGALRVQGKNLAGVWADEVGLWKPTQWKRAWDESIGFAVRKAPAIRIATGTPKRGHPLPRLLMSSPSVAQTLLLTEDNVANLDPATVARWKAQYEGTTLGRQELYGELLDDAEGALWNRSDIRYRPAIQMSRIVVAIDPAVTAEANSDETGIVVVGKGIDGAAYVLEDRSGTYSPLQWARQAIDAYAVRDADLIVAEANNGGDMVRLTLNTVDNRVPVKLVHASKGKFARAEPVKAKYEQSLVFHTEPMPDLEDQMCNWSPRDGTRSPDRIDALVWALTDLMLDDPWAGYSGSSIA